MKTTITKKDLKGFSFSDSGLVIDELAYCAKQWTSNQLWENNMEYEPNEPYMFEFEQDLFDHTKTGDELYSIAQTLGVSLNANWSRIAAEHKLEAGACVALNNPAQWEELLSAYTASLIENRTDGISQTYNEALQKAIDDYSDDQYREWLNGDYRNYAGVVKEIARYFTDEQDGAYNQKEDAYTFTLNETDIETAKEDGYRKNQVKKWILDAALSSGNNRYEKERAENEKRKEEYAKQKAYQAEQAAKKSEDRTIMLLNKKIK